MTTAAGNDKNEQEQLTMATKVPYVTLNNGVEMPILGLGVYQIPPEDTERAVSEALEAATAPT